jgi:hypothetical protein
LKEEHFSFLNKKKRQMVVEIDHLAINQSIQSLGPDLPKVAVQVMKLKEGYYVWVGSGETPASVKLSNLSLAMLPSNV